MNLNKTLTSAIVVVALSLATLPANAQDRRNEGRRRGGERQAASQPASGQNRAPQAVQRQAPREAAPQARQFRSEPRNTAPSQDRASRATPRQAPREFMPQLRQFGSQPRNAAPSQSQDRAPRAMQQRQAPREAVPQTRQFGSQPRNSAPGAYDNRQYQQRAVPRSTDRGAYQAPSYRGGDRGGYAQPRGSVGRYDSRSNYAGRYSRPGNYTRYQPRYFSRSYYSFRPRLSFGFGLWLGYAVPYPYSYLGSYRPRVWGYYPQGSLSVSVYGGVSFDIQPSDADLYVDGEYVGPIGDFTPYGEPLTLTPGVHRIEVQRDGYKPMSWDVTVEPGQVIPYRGAMEQVLTGL